MNSCLPMWKQMWNGSSKSTWQKVVWQCGCCHCAFFTAMDKVGTHLCCHIDAVTSHCAFAFIATFVHLGLLLHWCDWSLLLPIFCRHNAVASIVLFCCEHALMGWLMSFVFFTIGVATLMWLISPVAHFCHQCIFAINAITQCNCLMQALSSTIASSIVLFCCEHALMGCNFKPFSQHCHHAQSTIEHSLISRKVQGHTQIQDFWWTHDSLNDTFEIFPELFASHDDTFHIITPRQHATRSSESGDPKARQ